VAAFRAKRSRQNKAQSRACAGDRFGASRREADAANVGKSK
jgi:hypothetical protein